MPSLHLCCSESEPKAEQCLEFVLTRSWYMANGPTSHADLDQRFEWLSLIFSDNIKVRAAVLHVEYRQRLSQIMDDETAREVLLHQLYKLKCAVTPIYRLPVEILTEIFHMAFDFGELQAGLMLVCRQWSTIIEGMSSVWTSLELGTWITPERVEQLLGRAGILPLNVEIDIDKTGSRVESLYSAVAMAANRASQWAALTITSLPQSGQFINCPLFGHLKPMSQLKHLRIMRSISSPLLNQLLQNVVIAAVGNLASMEIRSFHAIQYLLQPLHTPILGSLTVFKAQVPKMSEFVDLLPHFTHIEELDLTNVLLPIYGAESLPLCHTLRHLRLRAVSIQWMGGHVFPKLESCTINSPPIRSHPLLLDVTLSTCTMFEISSKETLLRKFQIPNVDSLVLKSHQWSTARGNEQIADVYRVVFEAPLHPHTLHLSIRCHEKILLSVLQLLPDLKGLKLDLSRPSALRKRFFTALLAQPIGQVDWNQSRKLNLGEGWKAVVCPSLRVLELRYQQWLRHSDSLDFLAPLFALSWSRKRTVAPLKVDVHFKSSMGSWRSCELSSLSTSAISTLEIPPLIHSGPSLSMDLLEHFFTSVTQHFLETKTWKSSVYESLCFPLCSSHLQVLNLEARETQKLNVLPSFYQLKELSLFRIEVQPLPHDVDLPLAHTLRKLSLYKSTLSWMDGQVFSHLESFEVDEDGWPGSFQRMVRMPVCTHVLFLQDKLEMLPLLQSSFQLPLLDMWRLWHPWNDSKFDERGVNALQMTQARVFHLEIFVYYHGLLTFLESKDEVERLELELSSLSDSQGILAGLSEINGMTKNMPCPNMKGLHLQFWGLEYDKWEQVRHWCTQMMDKRISAGHPIERCCIWWDYADWKKPALLVLVVQNGKVRIDE